HLVASQAYSTVGTPTYKVYCYVVELAGGVTKTYTIDFPETELGCVAQLWQVTGDNTTYSATLKSVAQSLTNAGDSTTALTAGSALTMINWSLDAEFAFYALSTNNTVTPDASPAWTEDTDTGNAVPIHMESQFIIGADGGTSTGTASGTCNFGVIEVEIAEA